MDNIFAFKQNVGGSDMFGQFSWLAIKVAVGFLTIWLVSLLIQKVAHACSPDTGKNYYEHFESANDWSVSALRSRIDRIRAVKAEIMAYGENVGTLADDTCAIMRTVEDAYINNAKQFKNPEDYKLPREKQDAKIADQTRLARQRFADQKLLYSAVNGDKPLLECFYADEDDVVSAESELNIEVNELEKLLDDAQVKAAVMKKEKSRMTLGFMLPYLQDAVKSMGSEKKEGFFVERKGPALIARADELLGKAVAMKNELSDLGKQLDQENQMVRILNKKQESEKRNAESGGADDDIAATDAKYAAF